MSWLFGETQNLPTRINNVGTPDMFYYLKNWTVGDLELKHDNVNPLLVFSKKIETIPTDGSCVVYSKSVIDSSFIFREILVKVSLDVKQGNQTKRIYSNNKPLICFIKDKDTLESPKNLYLSFVSGGEDAIIMTNGLLLLHDNLVIPSFSDEIIADFKEAIEKMVWNMLVNPNTPAKVRFADKDNVLNIEFAWSNNEAVRQFHKRCHSINIPTAEVIGFEKI